MLSCGDQSSIRPSMRMAALCPDARTQPSRSMAFRGRILMVVRIRHANVWSMVSPEGRLRRKEPAGTPYGNCSTRTVFGVVLPTFTNIGSRSFAVPV